MLTNLARISTADIDIQPGDNDDWATITVVPGPAAQVLLSVSPSNPTVDCTAAVTATVLDAWGNPVADGTPVIFSTTAGTLGAGTVLTEGGLATATLTSDSLGGVAVVTATAGEIQSTTEVGFTVTTSEGYFIYLPVVFGDYP